MAGSGSVVVEVVVVVGPTSVTGPSTMVGPSSVVKPVPVGPSALVLAWVRARVVRVARKGVWEGQGGGHVHI